MIRFSEMVLSGHPDKFSDQVADAIISEAMAFEPEAYGQVEVATWGNEVWINGGLATERELPIDFAAIVRAVTARVGYVGPDPDDCHGSVDQTTLTRTDHPRPYRVHSAVCLERDDPRRWSRKVNDQTICVGWAGYDERTAHLPPEHFLAHTFRTALEESIDDGVLQNEGPDGKLLVRVREEGNIWRLEHVLVTLQQREATDFVKLVTGIDTVCEAAFRTARENDRRWRGDWSETTLLVNPNGPLVEAGSDGDNGQTGRKLVMDYYGPRVAIGGGALSGKHLTHIDRAGNYAAREAAVRAVTSGARECRVIVAYAPNEPQPLEVVYEMEGRGVRQPNEFFTHDVIRERYAGVRLSTVIARGTHFFDGAYPWNQP